MLKVAGVGVLTAIACMVLSRTGREEQAMAVGVAGILAAALILLTEAASLIGSVRSVFGF